jgi:hypothetical protein
MNQIIDVKPSAVPETEMQKFSNLEREIKKYFSFSPRMISKSVPKVDSSGETYGWERDIVQSGEEVFIRSVPDTRVLDAMQRPALRQDIAVHLQRLSEHKPYGRGAKGWQTVSEDLIRDLEGCSKWALVRTCEKYRLTRGITFFPDTAEIVHCIRDLDRQVSAAQKAETAEAATPQPQREAQARTTKRVRRVQKFMQLSRTQGKTKWEQLFFNALTERAKNGGTWV